MIKNKSGNIIGISSIVATSGNPGQSNYVAAKSGMIGFYKSIALEVASRNVNVNIVSPGFIVSPMTDKLNDKQKKVILEKIPMKRFGESNEVANLVYFLSNDESRYITGQNIHINGGMLMV
jgi:3-oxoacyl-[acyl-carrier protein] reductase